jgi:hypothetical protein
VVKRILTVLSYVAAGLYLLVDAIFMTLAKPISNWIDKHLRLRRLRSWIRSLRPYPSLALFSVPVIVLEPIKPIAAYLAATGQFLSGALAFIFGELLKLVLVERLFSLTRDKLMKIPAFARLYGWYSQAIAWLKATEAWRTLTALAKSGREHFKAIAARVAYWVKRRRRRPNRPSGTSTLPPLPSARPTVQIGTQRPHTLAAPSARSDEVESESERPGQEARRPKCRLEKCRL